MTQRSTQPQHSPARAAALCALVLCACDTRSKPEPLATVTQSSAARALTSAQHTVAPETARSPRPQVDVTLHVAAQPVPDAKFSGTPFTHAQLVAALAHAQLHELRPFGTTSTVLRGNIQGGMRAGFKAAIADRPFGPTAEVAAYRLARCLGVDSVPPAVMRRLRKRRLRHELEPASTHLWPKIAPKLLTDGKGRVEGALIYWIEGLQDLPITDASVRASVQATLRQAQPAPAADSIAAQLSTLQAFDYLIGNWDRFSGGNLKGDASGRILYVRDQDAAFAGRLRDELQRRMLDPVLATERFSRSFFTRLRSLTRADFERELAKDPVFASHPRLDVRSIRGLFDRRATLLSHIGALIEQYGQDAVLAFP